MLTTFSLIVLFFSIVIHEVAHGSMALRLGDSTAKEAGRLTLNPLKHIDLFGTIILPLFLVIMQSPFIIGWAKPVPVNPFNFKDQKWGSLKVAAAGPATNFLVGIIFSLAIRFIPLNDSVLLLFGIVALYNFAWGIFNLIPLPPFDGSHVLFTFIPRRFDRFKMFLGQYGLYILLFFIFFGGLTWVFGGAAFILSLVAGSSFVI